MYFLAAGELLARLQEEYPEDELFLVATACEIYGDEVFDLMGKEKLPASLKTDADGNLCVCGPPMKSELNDLFGELKMDFNSSKTKPEHATIVTRARALRCGIVRTVEDLDTISESALRLRVVGSSSEHQQSSRSHAILRMEVMNMEMYKAKEAADDAKALLPALKNAQENHWRECFNELIEPNSWSNDGTMALTQFEGGQEEWDKVYDALVAKRDHLKTVLSPILKNVDDTFKELEKVKNHKAVGGALVLVDLAGADYDKRDIGVSTTAKQKKESADINKSLLALKECFRFIAGVPGAPAHGPFRNSKLTRLLEDSLLPGAQSRKKNKSCSSVMVVNVSPAQHIAKQTMNVLRYGQIFTDGSKKMSKSNKT